MLAKMSKNVQIGHARISDVRGRQVDPGAAKEGRLGQKTTRKRHLALSPYRGDSSLIVLSQLLMHCWKYPNDMEG